MASWFKAAEDLFEVVDRRAKLVVGDLSDENSDSLAQASGGRGTQIWKSDVKAELQDTETPSPNERSEAGGVVDEDAGLGGDGIEIPIGSKSEIGGDGLYLKRRDGLTDIQSEWSGGTAVKCNDAYVEGRIKEVDRSSDASLLSVPGGSNDDHDPDRDRNSSPSSVDDSIEVKDEKKKGSASNVDEKCSDNIQDEAQGLLKDTVPLGQSKEARLARVCAGLSSRLQEYKGENAQLEELVCSEREVCRSYEVQLRHLEEELSGSRAEVSRMAEAVAAKNSEVEGLLRSMDALKKHAASTQGNLDSLQVNMDSVLRNRELTETRIIHALREEVASAERRAEEERASHNSTKTSAMRREAELENRAAEASTVLGRVQRACDERAVKVVELEEKVRMLEADCASLNQELQEAGNRLRRSQQRKPCEDAASQMVSQERLRMEVERARDAETKLASLELEAQKMRLEMSSARRDAQHYSRQEHIDLEKRYRDLTDLLYYKQTQLETVASEKAAVEFQLDKEVRRFREAPTWNVEPPLPTHRYARAARLLDSGAVRVTRFLSRYPLARLSLLLYFLFIHLFLMYLLHSLQDQADEFASRQVAKSMGLLDTPARRVQ